MQMLPDTSVSSRDAQKDSLIALIAKLEGFFFFDKKTIQSLTVILY